MNINPRPSASGDVKAILLLTALLLLPASSRAWETSLTVLPNASISYRGEGKILPQTYVNRFGGIASPLYRLDFTQDRSRDGYWGFSVWHTGEAGGGEYAVERLPDNTTGGTYQINELNVGFTNAFITYHRPLSDAPVTALMNLSVVRQIFKRRQFIVDGADLRHTNHDDVNEISAEGIGFGLAGKHGDRFFARWQTSANYYVQLFDAKTDASAGHIFLAETGLGARLTKVLSLEAGGLWQYWFILGQGDRRVLVAGNRGAVISWNRQETRASGGYVRLSYSFGD
jgi:hypothetical protein